MSEFDWDKVVIIGLIVCMIGYKIIKRMRMKCPKCGGRLVLDEITDPTGFNITKKVAFSFYVGPKKRKDTLKCVKCSHKVEDSYWSNQ